MTPAERRVWFHLKQMRAEGYHFRRQAPFLAFFLDFVCFSRRLVVEIDGGCHLDETQAAHDRMRDKVLDVRGFKTLRFTNEQVRIGLDDVIGRVRAELEQRAPTRPLRGHPPHEGEGYPG